MHRGTEKGFAYHFSRKRRFFLQRKPCFAKPFPSHHRGAVIKIKIKRPLQYLIQLIFYVD